LVTKTARKSIIKSNIEVNTTAEFAASPTPAVPFLQLYPLKHPTNPMANPKKKVLIVEGIISLNSKWLKTWLKYNNKET
jgi:hypothetical protein